MDGGKNWRSQIEDAIQASEWLVVVLTAGAVRSVEVCHAWQTARKYGVGVIPVGPPQTSADFQNMPRWMHTPHAYALGHPIESTRFFDKLREEPRVDRVPGLDRLPQKPRNYAERLSQMHNTL